MGFGGSRLGSRGNMLVSLAVPLTTVSNPTKSLKLHMNL